MKKIKFYHVSGLTALIIAACSASFSVYGLSVLFGSAKIASIILFSALEAGKIISVSALYNYAKKLPALARKYFPPAIMALMLVTSIGVGGYLINAYQKTSAIVSTTVDAQTSNTDQQNLLLEEINNYKQQIANDVSRKDTLNNQRAGQEARLNQAQANLNKRMQDQARNDIKLSDEEIKRVDDRISNTYDKIANKNNQLRTLKQESATIRQQDTKGEVGPLLYLAKLFSVNMDVIVIILIVIIIFIFDPLAIMLWLTTNAIVKIEKEEEKKIAPKTKIVEVVKEVPAPEKEFGQVIREAFDSFKKKKRS
jgi:hypothetical protein